MSVLSVIAGLFKPAVELIDNLTTTKEEKMAAKQELLQVQAGVLGQVLDYEQRLAELQSSVVIAEAQGQSWLQRNWRPLMMLLFGVIVLNNYILRPYFGVPEIELPPGMWTMLQIGLGGYVVGRSAEKIVQTVKR